MAFRVNPAEDYIDGETWNNNHVACCPSCGHAAVPVNPDRRYESWKHVSKPTTCNEDDEFPSMCYFVEFGIMYDDHTWDTEIVEVPTKFCHEDCTTDDLVDWANAVLGSQRFYRNVAQFTVFHLDPYNGR